MCNRRKGRKLELELEPEIVGPLAVLDLLVLQLAYDSAHSTHSSFWCY